MPDDHSRLSRAPSGKDLAQQHELELAQVTAALEHDVGISRDDLTSLILLESLKGFGPQKFKDLHRAGLRPIDVLREPQLLPTPGKRGERFRQALRELDAADRNVAQARAVRQLLRARDNNARIVTYDHAGYPRSVYDSNNPIPILYARGNLDLLGYDRSVACVGSRETSPPYSDRHYEFAAHACRAEYTIVSGFALGADTIGHRAAADTGGSTMLIMPCGLDRPFPPENRDLYTSLKDYGRAVIVSEFPFGTAASTLTLRKRNKLIVAFARGVMLSQTSAKGGAMSAYRFALEQRKPVATFEPDGEPRTSGNNAIKQGDERTGARRTEERLGGSASPPPTVFRADAADHQGWDAWLHQL